MNSFSSPHKWYRFFQDDFLFSRLSDKYRLVMFLMLCALAGSFTFAFYEDSKLGYFALTIINAVFFLFTAKGVLTEENFNERNRLPAFILDGLNDGVFDYDIKTNKVNYSSSYRAMLGYSAEDLGHEQDNFYKYMHPDDLPAAVETMEKYINKEIPHYHNIFRVQRKDGSWAWVMSRGVGIEDANGKIMRLVGTHTDVTEQKQREEELNFFIRENELQRAELAISKEKAEAANEAKSNFLATMSHEIRTPMNAVIGLSHVLLKTELNKKQAEILETLHANAGVLLRLVNDLLDLSRIEARQLEFDIAPFTIENLFHFMDTMFSAQASSKGLTLKLINNVGNDTFLGDMSRIQQIMVNLIGNALKFTLQGSITVTALAEYKDASHAIVHISVADTGVGIPSDKLDNVFDKFVQADQTISRRFGGSGLGLSICKSLANLMDGDIKLTSQVGLGSVFTLSLPLPRTNKKSMQNSDTPTSCDVPSVGTVLIVEDYAANIMVATLMLESLGYQIDVATNGLEAIAKLQASPNIYHAILMDVHMHGIDGLETTRRIRKLEQQSGKHHRIIGLTASATVGDRERCLEAGMDDYLSKPVQLEMLEQKLKAFENAA